MRPRRDRTDAEPTRDEPPGAAEPRRPIAHATKELSWVDDKSILPQQYTFYREDTPPPWPPDDAGTEPGQRPWSRGDGYDDGYAYDRVAPPAPIPASTIWGLRRRIFNVLLAVSLVVVVGIVVGVGVGVGVGSKRQAADSQQQQTPVTTTPPSSQASSSSTSDDDVPTAVVACPTANNTKYLDARTRKTFLRICGIDYTGPGQAVDLGAVLATSMQECMADCAGYPGCTACGWGVIPGDTGTAHRCWLKGDLQKAHVVRTGWDFAILQ
ncbi:Uncharacterized protein TCAP_00477 [Tolypocladium capitatum]|uniref:Apple domain-containing protein n=1 Tax=Tolypocladium capitatum TaxID=45235 RepID=A0A2K3QQ12_9HYPO|nr:Uncharacterized protein TCAP_00477 [Tolypocladium capitatum]